MSEFLNTSVINWCRYVHLLTASTYISLPDGSLAPKDYFALPSTSAQNWTTDELVGEERFKLFQSWRSLWDVCFAIIPKSLQTDHASPHASVGNLLHNIFSSVSFSSLLSLSQMNPSYLNSHHGLFLFWGKSQTKTLFPSPFLHICSDVATDSDNSKLLTRRFYSYLGLCLAPEKDFSLHMMRKLHQIANTLGNDTWKPHIFGYDM